MCADAVPVYAYPACCSDQLDIALPNTLEIIILLFIYAAEIMGEIDAYYVTFPYWDTGAAHPERLFVRGRRVLFA